MTSQRGKTIQWLRAWAKELEDMPQFRQCRGQLQEPGGRLCALGVLAEYAVGQECLVRDGTCYKYKLYDSEWECCKLPSGLVRYLGFKGQRVEFAKMPDGRTVDVVDLNDEADWTFKQIAKAIKMLASLVEKPTKLKANRLAAYLSKSGTVGLKGEHILQRWKLEI